MISRDEINHLAHLARLKLSDQEKDILAKDLASIVAYIDQIKEAPVGTVGQGEVIKHRNVFRSDESPHEAGMHTEALLAAAPERKGDYVKVKKILESGR